MSSTSLSASAVPTGSNCGSVLYDIPVKDVACAMPFSSKNKDIMSKCCKDADIVSYYNNCGLFCLAKDQSNQDLKNCFYKNGAVAGLDVFCNLANETETATATAKGQADVPRTAAATVVVTAGSSSSDGKGSGSSDKKDGDKNADKTADSASAPSNSGNAAGIIKPSSGINLAGVVIGALLFSATAFGAVQI